jgi:hypothetical protein
MREQAMARVHGDLNLQTSPPDVGDSPQLGEELRKLDHVLNSEYSPNTSAPAIDQILSNIARVENDSNESQNPLSLISNFPDFPSTRSNTIDTDDSYAYYSRMFVGPGHPDYVPLDPKLLEEIAIERKALLEAERDFPSSPTESLTDDEYYSKMFVPVEEKTSDIIPLVPAQTSPPDSCNPDISSIIDQILSNVTRVQNNNSHINNILSTIPQDTDKTLTPPDTTDSTYTDSYLEQCFVGNDHQEYVALTLQRSQLESIPTIPRQGEQLNSPVDPLLSPTESLTESEYLSQCYEVALSGRTSDTTP